MSDDSASSHERRGPSQRSLANLRPPCKPGEVRNPTGRNGRTKAEILALVMDEPSETDPNRRKIEMVIRAQYKRALQGSDIAARTLIEQRLGQPYKNPNALELAEHLRAVEKDRISTVIACLGSKLRTLTPEQMRDFFETCANDPQKFLTLAEKLMEGEAQPAVEQAEQAAQLPESKQESDGNG